MAQINLAFLFVVVAVLPKSWHIITEIHKSWTVAHMAQEVTALGRTAIDFCSWMVIKNGDKLMIPSKQNR